ncbi:DUF1707 SHOCT-like domain-containing protein [Actinokineospora iranica]|uniref:DUF1707 domain-containing protein n=1 Tax=Actinokineospora iranica TaxID=1271860 RepID=A0A1G6S3T8_9PSEU|nr:DUF1707 domain-containing protein [Actinokineospora iranica]SDD11580.1 protein of unknown function [Actinokineospora iranica]
MAHQRDMRVSDADRRAAAEELRAAHSQGRLSLAEFDSRLDAVNRAVTYGDLSALFADLPAVPAAAPAARSSVPKWVRIVWTWWTVTLVINLAVWALVRFQFEDDVHFWPVWLIIPTIAIAAVSQRAISARSTRQSRRTPAWRG